jgi:hypothetical protein
LSQFLNVTAVRDGEPVRALRNTHVKRPRLRDCRIQRSFQLSRSRQAQLNALLDLYKGEAQAAPDDDADANGEDGDTDRNSREPTVAGRPNCSPQLSGPSRHEGGFNVAGITAAPRKKVISPETKL